MGKLTNTQVSIRILTEIRQKYYYPDIVEIVKNGFTAVKYVYKTNVFLFLYPPKLLKLPE